MDASFVVPDSIETAPSHSGMERVSAVFPTAGRLVPSLKTLRVISKCSPPPDEIVVLVDGGDAATVAGIRQEFPNVRLIAESKALGPGGARGRLIEAACHDLVASFDDDSFPERLDFFERVRHDAELFPGAAVISAASHEAEWRDPGFREIAVYSGCGCVFRKSWFQRIAGFVPLKVAYAMEEVDVSLQLRAIGGKIIHDPDLRVIHDHPWATTLDPALNAAFFRNTALLPALRYPAWLLPLGLLQVLLHLARLVRAGATAGLWQGLRSLPSYLLDHWSFRRPVSGRAVLAWLALKRRPKTPEPRSVQSGGGSEGPIISGR